MLTLFFSGTGNTKYVANQFSKIMNYDCHSIEEDIDFRKLIEANKRICICYPIYGSRVPRIMAEFVMKYRKCFKEKEIIILATQLIASGDGARAFTDLFPKKYLNVIYAEHINMPNNVCNIALIPVKNGNRNRKTLRKANVKIKRICRDIQSGKVIRRGFNVFSRIMGFSQGAFENKMNSHGKKSVVVDSECVACGLCVKACPMKNLELMSGKIKHHNDCTMCYRCVNLCPKQAITVLIHKKPKEQYHGI